MTSHDNFSVKQGDTTTKVLTVTDDNGVVVNLTGATLTAHLRLPNVATDALSQALVLTTPAAGIATLTLTSAQTAALAALRSYTIEVELVDALGNITTPIDGLVYVGSDLG